MREILELFKRLLAFASSQPPTRPRQQQANKAGRWEINWDAPLPDRWKIDRDEPLPDRWRFDEPEQK